MDQSQEINQENLLFREGLHQIIDQKMEVNLEEMEILILILDKKLEKSLDQVLGQEIDFHLMVDQIDQK